MSSQFVYILSIHHSFRIFFSPAPPLSTSKKRELDEGEKKLILKLMLSSFLKLAIFHSYRCVCFFLYFRMTKYLPHTLT